MNISKLAITRKRHSHFSSGGILLPPARLWFKVHWLGLVNLPLLVEGLICSWEMLYYCLQLPCCIGSLIIEEMSWHCEALVRIAASAR